MTLPEYLYHYTSIDALASILKNRTIRFNSLENMDDPDEIIARDLQSIGRFKFSSCWTDIEDESFPLWGQYTPNMDGVRIKLPRMPFKKYYSENNETFYPSRQNTTSDRLDQAWMNA